MRESTGPGSPSSARRAAWRRRVVVGAATAAACLALLNALAYRHAQAFTRFSERGVRTPKPEQLTWPQRIGVLFAGPVLPRPANASTPADVGLRFETVRLEAEDGVSLEAWWVPAPGARGAVALFHGYADSKDSLLAEARVFHELGFDALLVDHRGSGGSDGHETTLGWREALDVAAGCARLRERAGPVVVFGASMGAAAALRAAGEGWCAADALILQAPFDRLRTTLGNRFRSLGVPAFPAADLLTLWGGWLRGFDAAAWNPVDYAPRVRVPVLLLHGADDVRVRVAEVKALAGRCGGPATLRIFPGLGHGSLVRHTGPAWREAVAAQLDALGGEGRAS